jgi:hypothetical protein
MASGQLHPCGRSYRYPMTMWQSGLQSRCRCYGEMKNFLPFLGLKPLTTQPVTKSLHIPCYFSSNKSQWTSNKGEGRRKIKVWYELWLGPPCPDIWILSSSYDAYLLWGWRWKIPLKIITRQQDITAQRTVNIHVLSKELLISHKCLSCQILTKPKIFLIRVVNLFIYKCYVF